MQHPTLATPFLDKDTIIDCNGIAGFNQSFYKNIAANTIQWPLANNGVNLRNMPSGVNAVHSFVVNENSTYGWITAYSPSCKLLLGYIWKRTDYTWLHIWKHYNDSMIQYLGMEFGTAGIHQPFKEILNTATHLFGEKTVGYIDSGESVSKKYLSFTHSMEADAGGVMNVEMQQESLVITPINGAVISMKLSNNISHGL